MVNKNQGTQKIGYEFQEIDEEMIADVRWHYGRALANKRC
jgi:hypothetical protein